MAKEKDQVTTSIRIPAKLKEWLDNQAGVNRRSFNAEVIVTLEKAQKEGAENAS